MRCKAGREPNLTEPLGVATEINLHVPALLPETYCSDVHERLVLYKRLANCDSRGADEHAGGTDRSLRPAARADAGAPRLPPPAPDSEAARRGQGRRRAERTQLQFGPSRPSIAGKLIAMVQQDGRYRFAGPDRDPHRARRAGARGSRRAGESFLGQPDMSAAARRRRQREVARCPVAAAVRVFVRDWLSANNVLLKEPRRPCADRFRIWPTRADHACAPRVAQGLGREPLTRLVNTHCHSDHMGGNAAIQARYRCPDCAACRGSCH